MTIKALFLMDNILAIKPEKDTSFRLALEAQQRGWETYYLESNALFFDGQLKGQTQRMHLSDCTQHYCQLSEAKSTLIKEFDVLFLRSDPPFDANYLYRTQLLDLIKDDVLVVNDPTSVRSFNEKLFSLAFAKYTPPTLISRDISQLRTFLQSHKKIVIKPLDSMGGNGVFVLSEFDPNVSVILESQTNFGKNLLIAQQYLPEIKYGDKRILLIHGKPVPYLLARIPADGESRGNLNAGAKGEVRAITEEEYGMTKMIGDYCVNHGLYLVGVDMIGNKVTEINITSPTCMREIEKAMDLNLAKELLNVLTRKLTS